MKIYLAIPYTGKEEESFKIANRIAGKLMCEGHIVFSPISHTHPIACECEMPKHWEFWRKFDECFIEWCDEVRVIKFGNYTLSTGVMAEIKIAVELDKPIFFMNPGG